MQSFCVSLFLCSNSVGGLSVNADIMSCVLPSTCSVQVAPSPHWSKPNISSSQNMAEAEYLLCCATCGQLWTEALPDSSNNVCKPYEKTTREMLIIREWAEVTITEVVLLHAVKTASGQFTSWARALNSGLTAFCHR